MSVLLGLRLAAAGGREGLARLVLVTVGVGIGVALLLLSLAGQSALREREARSAWQDTAHWHRLTTSNSAPAPDDALWLGVSDHYAGRPLHRAQVAALGPRPPVPPGLDRLPGPGEVAVSPALRRLLATTPDDRLGARFPGRVTMTIGPAGLRHPDQLVALVGRTPQEMRQISGVKQVDGVATRSLNGTVFTRIALGLASILLLGPIGVFIIMVTRIAAARREQRLAAIRLVGATRTQVAAMAAPEAGLGAAAGAAAGLLGYLATLPAVAANLRHEGGGFFAEDFAVPLYQLVLVLAGVPALAMAVAIISLRRVRSTPLDITRLIRPRPLSLRRAVPLVAGVAGILVLAALYDTVESLPDDGLAVVVPALYGVLAQAFLVCVMLGLIISGPWVCELAGRALARFGGRAATLLAARRMTADPRAVYRAVSGVSLAVFVIAVAAGFTAGRDGGGPYLAKLHPGVVEIYTGGESASDPGLSRLMPSAVAVSREVGGPGEVRVKCAELVKVAEVSCPFSPSSDRPYEDVSMALFSTGTLAEARPGTNPVDLPVHALYIQTDGTAAAEERVRTQAALLVPNAIVTTRGDVWYPEFGEFGNPLPIVAMLGLMLAGCGLGVSMVGGLFERRRPFALLRASGVSLRALRGVVMLETAVPMLATALLGFGVAWAMRLAFALVENRPVPLPRPELLLTVGGGVLLALAISAVALPLVNATTRYNAVRYE